MTKKVEFELADNFLIIKIEEMMSNDAIEEVCTKIDESEFKDKILIMDLEKVTYLSSMAIGGIVKINHERDLRLVNLPKNVLHILELANLVPLLKIFDSFEEAAKKNV